MKAAKGPVQRFGPFTSAQKLRRQQITEGVCVRAIVRATTDWKSGASHKSKSPEFSMYTRKELVLAGGCLTGALGASAPQLYLPKRCCQFTRYSKLIRVRASRFLLPFIHTEIYFFLTLAKISQSSLILALYQTIHPAVFYIHQNVSSHWSTCRQIKIQFYNTIKIGE